MSNKQKPVRDKMMAILVLNGQTYSQVAAMFNVTHTTVRKHTMKECYKILGIQFPMHKHRKLEHGGEVYYRKSEQFYFPVSLSELKKQKDYLVAELSGTAEIV